VEGGQAWYGVGERKGRAEKPTDLEFWTVSSTPDGVNICGMPSLDQDAEEVSRDTKRDANMIFDALVAGERHEQENIKPDCAAPTASSSGNKNAALPYATDKRVSDFGRM